MSLTSWVKSPKGKRHPRQEAQPGDVWLHIGRHWDERRRRYGEEYVMCVALVVGELRVGVGNYPMVMLDSIRGFSTTRAGDRFNAAVTTARGWKKLT